MVLFEDVCCMSMQIPTYSYLVSLHQVAKIVDLWHSREESIASRQNNKVRMNTVRHSCWTCIKHWWFQRQGNRATFISFLVVSFQLSWGGGHMVLVGITGRTVAPRPSWLATSRNEVSWWITWWIWSKGDAGRGFEMFWSDKDGGGSFEGDYADHDSHIWECVNGCLKPTLTLLLTAKNIASNLWCKMMQVSLPLSGMFKWVVNATAHISSPWAKTPSKLFIALCARGIEQVLILSWQKSSPDSFHVMAHDRSSTCRCDYAAAGACLRHLA